MILKTALLIKILLPAAIIALGGFFLRKRLTRGQLLGLGVLVVLFAFAANAVSSLVPPLRDEVTLTALGEKREEASAEEVYLAGYTIDGKEYLAGKDMKLLDGKWFWKGETYCWRIETDERQPEGVTRTVTVGIPVGWDRTLNFESNVWRGMVEISAGGKTTTVDTYSEDGTAVTVSVGRSETSALVWSQVRYLAVYAAVLLALSGFACALETERLKIKPLTLLRIVITLAAFAVMWHYAGVVSLWSDDFATIHFVAEGESLQTIIQQIEFECGYNPPLFYILAYFWLRIAPYGTAWLKLPSMVFASLGIWFCGVAAKRIRGERAAVMATILAATSYFLFNYAAFTFRNFGLLFMLCPLLIIAYHKRLSQPKKVSAHICYGLMLTLLLYTNYISFFVIAAVGLYDCWLFYKKKIKLNCIISYIGAGVLFLPLFLFAVKNMVNLHENFWPATPDTKALQSIINLIFSDQIYLIVIFFAGAITALYCSFCMRKQGEDDRVPQYVDICAMLALWAVFVVGADYLYSRYINPSGSIFVHRYFISVLAPIIILISVGLDVLIDIICEGKSRMKMNAVAVLTALVCLVPPGNRQLNALNSFPGAIREPYEQAIDWIYGHANQLWPDSLVIMSGYTGGFYYYTTRDGRRDNLNYGTLTESNWEEYSTVFTVPLHGELSAETVQILNEHFTVVEQNKDLKVTVYARNAE